MLNIDLNFDDVYEVQVQSSDLTKFTFESPITGGGTTEIHVWIQAAQNAFLQEFLNLCFGPVVDVQMNDFASVSHENYSKAFSTVLFCALAYLETDREKYIGVDGSDFRRAYLYYRTIQRNYNYLTDYFRMYGVKYYARVLRGKDKNDHMSVDVNELYSVPFLIENKPLDNHKSLFNYFIFYLSWDFVLLS